MTKTKVNKLHENIVKGSVLELASDSKIYQDIMKWWDFWDFKIVSSYGIDDPLEVVIFYKKRNGSKRILRVGYQLATGLYIIEDTQAQEVD